MKGGPFRSASERGSTGGLDVSGVRGNPIEPGKPVGAPNLSQVPGVGRFIRLSRIARVAGFIALPAFGLMIASLYVKGWEPLTLPLISLACMGGGLVLMTEMGIMPFLVGKKKGGALVRLAGALEKLQALLHLVLGAFTFLAGVGIGMVLLTGKR